jgi:hypothetical protein
MKPTLLLLFHFKLFMELETSSSETEKESGRLEGIAVEQYSSIFETTSAIQLVSDLTTKESAKH